MYDNRIESIDLFRVIAIAAVIVIHTTPFNASGLIGNQVDAATLVDQLARFAVPFLFILSGFFWGSKVEAKEKLKGTTLVMAKRILFLFLAWSVIYLLPTNLLASFDFGVLGPVKKVVWNLNSAANRPWNTLFQGTKEHLWYLMGLLCSLSISAVLVWYRQKALLVFVAVAFYITGLAGGAYSTTPVGFHSEFNFRNGPFF
jgi:surface polysaccharide O-acyltransferase-like enzyme